MMQSNSTRDLLTDFSDYGYCQLPTLTSPQNSLTSRPSKLAPLHLRESSIEKSKERAFNKSITIPLGSYSSQTNPDNSTPKGAANRFETLRIFQKKQMKSTLNQEVSSVKKRDLKGQIKFNDSVQTIEAMVKEAKKEYQTRRKKQNKGTMFVNDLWAQVYQKEVIKQSGMEKIFKQKHKTGSKPTQSSPRLNLTDRSTEESSFTPKNNPVPVLPPMLIANEIPSDINLDTSDFQYSDRTFRAPETPKKILSEPIKAVQERRIYRNKNIWDPTRQNCHSVLRASSNVPNQSLSSRIQNFSYSSKNAPVAETERSIMRDYSLEDSVDTNRSALRRIVAAKPINSLQIHRLPLDLTLDLKDSSSTFRGRAQRNHFSSFLSEKKSPRTLSEKSKAEVEAAKTRLYLEGKNAQVKELLVDCEVELRERGEWISMVQDLQGLFENQKFDKLQKLALEQKMRLINECRSSIYEKGVRKFL